MTLCSVPFRFRRVAAIAAAGGGGDSGCESNPSSPSRETSQLLVRRTRQFKAHQQPSALKKSVAAMSGKKLNKVRSIVRHWKKLTQMSQGRYSSLSEDASSSPEPSNSDRNFGVLGDCSGSDLEGSPSKNVKRLARSAATDDVPEGCLALFVGRERRKFVIGAHYLEHNLFRGLLERSAAQFGFEQKGGITIACEVVLFEHLLWLIGTDDPSSRHLQVDELLDFYAY